MGIKSSLLDSRLTAAVIRRRDRAEIVVFFFYLYMIRSMKGSITDLLKLGGESGYSYFSSKSKWQYISYWNSLTLNECQLKVGILDMDFLLFISEMEAGDIIGQLFNLKYEIEHRWYIESLYLLSIMCEVLCARLCTFWEVFEQACLSWKRVVIENRRQK